MSENNIHHNDIGVIGLIFSLVGLILVITIVGSGLGIIFLILGLIFGIIGLFFKPKTSAIIAVIIPSICIICLSIFGYFVYNGAKPFIERANGLNNSEYIELINKDDFELKTNIELQKITNSLTNDSLNERYAVSVGNNAIEKWSFVLFSILQESIESTFASYGLPDKDSEIRETNTNEPEIDTPSTQEETTNTNSDNGQIEELKQEQTNNTQDNTFSTEEKENIKDIINILE